MNFHKSVIALSSWLQICTALKVWNIVCFFQSFILLSQLISPQFIWMMLWFLCACQQTFRIDVFSFFSVNSVDFMMELSVLLWVKISLIFLCNSDMFKMGFFLHSYQLKNDSGSCYHDSSYQPSESVISKAVTSQKLLSLQTHKLAQIIFDSTYCLSQLEKRLHTL